MPMLRISVEDDHPRLHGSSTPLGPTLRHALSCDPGPVKIMIHGYKYLPGHPIFCPHDGILSRAPRREGPRVVSWPRHLGLRGQQGEGLGISFGWAARGKIWAAYDQADSAGNALALLLADIQRIAPGRCVQLIAHSLGGRVALKAVKQSQPGDVSHAILLAAAEFGSVAKAALTTKAGQQVAVLNVTSRENDLYDFMLERLVRGEGPNRRTLGHGCTRLPNMATLQLDDLRSIAALRQAGYPIAPPQRRVCHWSPYLRPGVFPLYRAFLTGKLPVPHLRAVLPTEIEPRWARFSLRSGLFGPPRGGTGGRLLSQ
ncbi:alpha/beta hydrolase [Pelagimonas varians]|uniref:Alpha/beta hydrolase family protein n=1 Tax=Pelagimonas varians TaxID=696760 RepID=A0A238KX58_9RHOB|nr:alpha/beta hydrolase [Pelagimonas varians]PYG27748.1 alpha/beta hydrolase family protein DUF900 [Pelagimonas varians]SMX47369.1 hypothetical protein PEV8663_03523 [Pelagimonas varians]